MNLKYKLVSFIYWVLWRIMYLPADILEEMDSHDKRFLVEKRYPNAHIEWCHRCKPDDTFDDCQSLKGVGTNIMINKSLRYRESYEGSNKIIKFLFRIRFFSTPPEYLDYKLRPTEHLEQDSHYFDSGEPDWHLTGGCGFSICRGCYESIQEYGNRYIIFYERQRITFIADDEYVIQDYSPEFRVYGGYSGADFQTEIQAIQAGKYIVPTGGWRPLRGFKVDEDIMVSLGADTLLDGHGSEHQLKAKHDLLIESSAELNVPLFFVNSHTGNACTRNIDYFIRTENKEKMEKILAFINTIVEAGNYTWNTNIIFQSKRSADEIKTLVECINKKLSKVNQIKDLDKKSFWNAVAENPDTVIANLKVMDILVC